jgi:glucokinase
MSSTVIGIDIGGTKTKIGYRKQGSLETIAHFETPRDPDRAIFAIEEKISEFLEQNGALNGIGIGCPGPLDQEAGVVLTPPNLPGWRDVPLGKLLQERFDVPVRLENDGNAGALGEAVYGEGAGFHTVFYCTISTGIGAGIVIDGKIHRGRCGLAAEVWAFEPEYYYGRKTGITIEDRSSGNGIVSQARRLLREGRASSIPFDNITTRTVIGAFEQGDTLATEILEQARNMVGGMLVNAITFLAPDIIVLAGGLCTNPAWYVDPVAARVAEWVKIKELQDTPIKRAKLWDSAVLYGAIRLAEQTVESG